MKEDISVFFADFATPVSAHTSDGLFTFRAIFDDGDLAARLGDTKADLTQPRLTCSMVDAARLARKVRVTVFERPGQTGPGDYTVLEILPEGTGTAIIILTPANDAAPGAKALHETLLDDGSE